MSVDFDKLRSDLNRSVQLISESVDSHPDLGRVPIDEGERQILDELHHIRRDHLDTLIGSLRSQVIALERAARAAERHADSAEEQVRKLQGMLDAAQKQADLAEKQAKASEESARKSHRWFVASSVAAVLSAVAALYAPLRELLSAFFTLS